MSEPKTKCAKCGVEILETTARRTDGLCLPCKMGRPRPPDPNEPLEVSCSVDSGMDADVVFFVAAQVLLQRLEETHHVGDSSHVNKLELEAQKGLLRHAIRYRVGFWLHDDQWMRTGFALLELFENDKAVMQLGEKRFRFAELSKEEWQEGTDPLGSCGGFLYRDRAGAVVFKTETWIS